MTEAEELEYLRLKKKKAEAAGTAPIPEDNKSWPEKLFEGTMAGANASSAALPFIGSHMDWLKSQLNGSTPEAEQTEREALAKQYPIASGIGTGLGTAASFLAPFAGEATGLARVGKLVAAPLSEIIPATTRIGRVVNSFGQGLLGAYTNGNNSGGDNPLQRLRLAIPDAALSGAASGLAEGLQSLAGGKDAAARWAFRAIKPTAGDFNRQIEETGAAIGNGQGVGRELLDQGVLGGALAPSRATMLERLESAKAGAGQGVQDAVNEMNERAVAQGLSINKKDILGRIRELLNLNPDVSGYGNKLQRANDLDQEFSMTGPQMSPEQVQTAKVGTQNQLNYDKQPEALGREAIHSQYDRAKVTALKEQLEQMANRVDENATEATGKVAPAFQSAKQSYGNLDTAQDILQSAVAADKVPKATNIGKLIGLPASAYFGSKLIEQLPNHPDTFLPIMAGAGALTGANAFVNAYGPQTAAKLLDANINPNVIGQGVNTFWNLLNQGAQK